MNAHLGNINLWFCKMHCEYVQMSALSRWGRPRSPCRGRPRPRQAAASCPVRAGAGGGSCSRRSRGEQTHCAREAFAQTGVRTEQCITAPEIPRVGLSRPPEIPRVGVSRPPRDPACAGTLPPAGSTRWPSRCPVSGRASLRRHEGRWATATRHQGLPAGWGARPAWPCSAKATPKRAPVFVAWVSSAFLSSHCPTQGKTRWSQERTDVRTARCWAGSR